MALAVLQTLNVTIGMSVFGLSGMNEWAMLGQASVMLGLCQILLFIVSLFLILLVLVQRGKGGGLTGALGGMGGQSAFGTKAGDAFTKVTVFTTIIWITICMVTISGFNPPPAAKVTKKMTLMEKARNLDRSASIGAPSNEVAIPDDLNGDGQANGDGAGAAAGDDSEGTTGNADGGIGEGVQDTGDNVAEKQTPENTGTAAMDAGAESEAPELEPAAEEKE